jgi:hypothetical protein
MFNDTSRPILNNCTFSNNSAQVRGGGMYNDESNPMMTSCTFNENMAIDWDGGAIFNMGGGLVLADCQFIGNIAGDWGGAMCTSECSLTLSNCTIINNTAGTEGGSFYLDWSEMTLNNCVVAGNTAAIAGGGVYSDGSITTLTNCTFALNSAESGNAFACDTWWFESSNITLTSCILWDGSDEIWNNDNSTISINYSNVPVAGDPWSGVGNINADPLFADVNGGDYHLKSQAGRWESISQSWVQDDVTSPCVDAGDPTASVGSEPQPNGGIINMGAYGGTPEASMSQ